MEVLVDSSVWIEIARKKSSLTPVLKNIIASNRVFTSDVIRMETAQGARDRLHFDKLWDSFLGLEFLPSYEGVWRDAALNFFACKKKGITLGSTDSLIATIAVHYRVRLLTLDEDFFRAGPILGLDLVAL